MSHKMRLSEKEWAYVLLNIAEIIASSNASARMINKIYDTDPLLYYQNAQMSPYYSCSEITSYPILTEENIKRALGVLYTAEQCTEAEKEILKVIKHLDPVCYEFFSKFNNKTAIKFSMSSPPVYGLHSTACITIYLADKLLSDDQFDRLMKSPSFSDLQNLAKRKLADVASFSDSRLAWSVIRTRCDEILEIVSHNALQMGSSQTEKYIQKIRYPTSESENIVINTPHNPEDLFSLSLGYHDPYQEKHVVYGDLSQALERYKESVFSDRDALAETFSATQGIHGLLELEGINHWRFFSENKLFDGANGQAAKFSSRYSQEKNAYEFDPELFTCLYSLVCVIRKYQALKEDYRKLNPESQKLALNLAEDQIQLLKEQLSQEKAKNKSLNFELEVANKKLHGYEKDSRMQQWGLENNYKTRISEMQTEISFLQRNRQELLQLRDFFFSLQEADRFVSDDMEVSTERKRVLSEKRIVTVGGHIQFRKQLKKMYPTFLVLDGTLNTQDFQVIEHADHVFIFVQNMSHSTYYKLMEKLEHSDVPFTYINTTNYTVIEDIMYQKVASSQ